MSFLKYIYAKTFRPIVIMAMGLLALSSQSCSLVYDSMEDCEFGLHIRFRYDYNMSFGDAFAAQVGRVSVFVFDDEGKFIMSRTEEGEVLSEEDYRMYLDLPAGKYRIVCWGGCYDESFVHHKLSQGDVPDIASLELLMVRGDDDEVMFEDGRPLRSLFWGEIEALELKDNSVRNEDLNLMKLTNQIKVTMVNRSGDPVSSDDFEFYMDGANGRISADDASLLEDDLLKFHPYYISDTSAPGSKALDLSESVSVEYSCPRLVMDDTVLRLHAVDRKTGRDVLDFPLVKNLAAYAMSSYETADGILHLMDTQEYLDRADLYNMTFILQDGTWTQVEIQILNWSVRIFNVDI